MKIIDCENKGNCVRFYLGEKTKDWGWVNPDYKVNGKTPDWLSPEDFFCGDDWDDPYGNDGRVYDEFIKGKRDICFPFDWLVFLPKEGSYIYSKEKMVKRMCPCIIAVDPDYLKEKDISTWSLDYEVCLGIDDERVHKYYFGDDMMAEQPSLQTIRLMEKPPASDAGITSSTLVQSAKIEKIEK